MGHLSLSVRLEGFGNLGQLYVDNLVLNGEQSKPDDWFSMVENLRADFQEPGFDEAGAMAERYSMQFWIPHGYDQEFMAAGAFGQSLWKFAGRERWLRSARLASPCCSQKEKTKFRPQSLLR